MFKKRLHEPVIEFIIRVSSYISILAVAFIILFILSKGIQPFLWFNKEGTYPFFDFIGGMTWDPSDIAENSKYGIFYMIIGSVLGTGGAILIGVPISLFAAAFLSELAPPWIQKIIRNGVLLMAGVPSVIYGIFGLGFIVPLIAKVSPNPFGESLLAVIVVLTMMILPTMIAIAENAIASVPQEYRQASYALGASKVYTTMHVLIPAARRGILVGIVLGVGRAIGEAMAVVLVAGNVASGLPTSIFDPIRPLTTNVVLEMSYASGLHEEMLFSTGSVLLILIIIINVVLSRLTKRMGQF